MSEQKIIYQGFYKGISQDDYTTSANQVLYSTGLNLNSDTYSVSLEADFTEGITTNGNKMLSWFYVTDNGAKTAAVAGEDGEVYKWGGTNDTANYIFSDTWTTRNAINSGGYVFFVRVSGTSQIRIGKMAETNSGFTSVTDTLTTTGDTIPNGIAYQENYPMYNYNGEVVLIGIGGKLMALEVDTDVVTNYDLFSSNIVGITKIGSQFKIYSSDGTVAFWSYGNAGITESFKINDVVRGAVNRGNSDFIISGGNSPLANINISSGYEAPVVNFRYDSDRLDREKFRVDIDNSQSLTTLGDTIYFINETDVGLDTLKAVWSYGRKNRSLGDAYQEVFTIADSGSQGIYSMYGISSSTSRDIYIGGQSTSAYRLIRYSPSNSNQSSGYMVLNTLDGGDRMITKKLKEISATVSGCSVDNTITISASFNQGDYEVLKTITTEGNSVKVEFYPDQEWQDVNFKIGLIDGGAGTPKFHGMKVIYEIIE